MDNRTNLLRVALRLFATHGYDGVGVQQIVTEAGVTKPTLYHYFHGKLGLFQSLVEEKSDPLLADLKAAAHYEGDLTKSITAVTQLYFDFLQREPFFYRLMLATWFMPPSSDVYSVIHDFQSKQFALVEQMFLDAVSHHGNMRGRHKQYAVSLRGMIDTYVGLALQGHLQLGSDDMNYRIVHQFMHGIFS
ncbi:MAG: TetR/AcrR family transcriptional regulator [Anaerolineae bacterium]